MLTDCINIQKFLHNCIIIHFPTKKTTENNIKSAYKPHKTTQNHNIATVSNHSNNVAKIAYLYYIKKRLPTLCSLLTYIICRRPCCRCHRYLRCVTDCPHITAALPGRQATTYYISQAVRHRLRLTCRRLPVVWSWSERRSVPADNRRRRQKTPQFVVYTYCKT